MWNQFLNESRTDRKFDNVPVIVLGTKHSGKRSLIDSLFDISKTTLHNKRFTVDANKMKLRGLAPIIDYAYLNVVDLSDPDYSNCFVQIGTHSKLQVYMIEDKYDFEVFSQLGKPQILKKAVIIIMLDFTNPWSFMEELDGWINFVYELQKKAGLSIVDLEQMADNVSKYYKAYKEPELDDNGKMKKYFGDENLSQVSVDIPLPEGVLTNNIRMPLIVCVNKCDFQSSVLGEDSSNKIQLILYHLRKFCIKYGASLIYTSIKNNSNLNTLYEYILHRSYQMPLRFKKQFFNQEAIFIPFGADSPNVIEDSILKLDVSKSYTEAIQMPLHKRPKKDEVLAEEDSDFFKKYINTAASSQITDVTTSRSSNIDEIFQTSARQQNSKDFFQGLKNKNNERLKKGFGRSNQKE